MEQVPKNIHRFSIIKIEVGGRGLKS